MNRCATLTYPSSFLLRWLHSRVNCCVGLELLRRTRHGGWDSQTRPSFHSAWNDVAISAIYWKRWSCQFFRSHNHDCSLFWRMSYSSFTGWLKRTFGCPWIPARRSRHKLSNSHSWREELDAYTNPQVQGRSCDSMMLSRMYSVFWNE